jgi:hypothetical protein
MGYVFGAFFAFVLLALATEASNLYFHIPERTLLSQIADAGRRDRRLPPPGTDLSDPGICASWGGEKTHHPRTGQPICLIPLRNR